MRLLVLAAFVLAQAATPPAPTERPVPLVDSDRYVKDVQEKNVLDILTLYKDDAACACFDGKKYKGTAELKKFYEDLVKNYDTKLYLTTTKYGQSRSFGIEHGVFTATRRSHGTGKDTETRGTYVFLYEHQSDGRWLIERQTFTVER